MPTPSTTRVAIVGSGLSGLTAAHRLITHGMDSVMVLEATSRAGGRVVSTPVGTAGTMVDEGATLVYPVQHDALALAGELGVETFGSGTDGQFVFRNDGAAYTFDFGNMRGMHLMSRRALQPLLRIALSAASRWSRLPMSPTAILELLTAMRKLDELVATVPLDAPWDTPGADRLDHTSLASWVGTELRTLQARGFFEALFGFFSPSTSLLHALHVMRTWGGLTQLFTGQSEVYRFHGGAQALVDALTDSLGDRVRLDTPVQVIEQGPADVILRTSNGDVTADRVIVTVPPSGCRAIQFVPELPPGRRILNDSWQEVHGLKINAVYPEPFWRDDGFSGSALADFELTPGTLDASPADGSAGVLASYVTVTEGREGVFAGDPTKRRADVLANYAELFGPKAADPVEYLERNWKDEKFIFGCEGSLATGALTGARTVLRDPFGRVHWAGTDTADRWVGYMNGAIQAGERAATEVLST